MLTWYLCCLIQELYSFFLFQGTCYHSLGIEIDTSWPMGQEHQMTVRYGQTKIILLSTHLLLVFHIWYHAALHFSVSHFSLLSQIPHQINHYQIPTGLFLRQYRFKQWFKGSIGNWFSSFYGTIVFQIIHSLY